MTASTPPNDWDLIAERIDRLLLRHAELQRTNSLLTQQVAALQAERDALLSRLNTARARVDALLAHLPTQEAAANNNVTPLRQEHA